MDSFSLTMILWLIVLNQQALFYFPSYLILSHTTLTYLILSYVTFVMLLSFRSGEALVVVECLVIFQYRRMYSIYRVIKCCLGYFHVYCGNPYSHMNCRTQNLNSDIFCLKQNHKHAYIQIQIQIRNVIAALSTLLFPTFIQ